MANLYATNLLSNDEVTDSNNDFLQKKSYAIDFNTMKFIKNQDGTVKLLDELESYMQWCQLAMMTSRKIYMAYSDKFGKDIIGSDLDKAATELEIKRITQDALMVHPLTESVDNFTYTWEGNKCFYEYDVNSTLGLKRLSSETS